MVFALCTACRADERPAANSAAPAAAQSGSAGLAPEPPREDASTAGRAGGSPSPAGNAALAGTSAPGTAGQQATAEAPKPRADDDEHDAGAIDAAAEPGTTEPDLPPRSTDPVAPDLPFVPAETADADALRRLADWSALPELGDGHYRQHGSSDRRKPSDGLESFLPLFGFGNRDLNNFVCRSEDAVIDHVPIVPFTFDHARCAESYVRGVVLARYEGSGRFVRMWMTVTSLALEGRVAGEMLRIYVDDHPQPLLQARLADILSGEAGEIFAPPFGAASKGFLAWYYPVVFSRKLIVALDRLSSEYYHQTDVVLDPAPRRRFAPRDRLAERDRARSQLMAASPLGSDATVLESEHLALTPTATATVELEGPATIQEVRVRVSEADFERLAGVQLSVRWDGRREPAIDLPLRELFASGNTLPARSNFTLAATTQAGIHTLSLRLPMPFSERAEWSFRQTGTARATFDVDWLGVERVPRGPFGRLQVQRVETPLPTIRLEQPVASVSGRGRYVGLCADVAGDSEVSLGTLSAGPLNILEGDFRAIADGNLVLDGTGTEDYPDNSFYFMDSPHATPFAQNWGLVDDLAESPDGQVSFCRWQILGNEIDFQREFSLTHEIAVQDPSIVRLHRTVAYLYVAP